MAAPRWTIENYNAFMREAKDEWGLSHAEAQEAYREIREWKVGAVYGADVDRYREELFEDPGLAEESILYGAEGMIGPEPTPIEAAEPLDDDYVLEPGAELEFTAQTYKSDEA